jgi:hypothetical protein
MQRRAASIPDLLTKVDYFCETYDSMSKKTLKVLLVLLGIYSIPVFLSIGFVTYLILRPLPPLAPLPNPNAYDDLVKAGGLVATNTKTYLKMTVYQLRPVVQQNMDALSQARDVLDSPCCVPVDYTEGGWRNRNNNTTKLRALSQAFAAEARLAQMDKQVNRAAQVDVDLMRLGADAARGGILDDAFFGQSIETLGANDLTKLMSQLDAKTCREAAATLEQLDGQRASWADVMKQEDVWIRHVFTWRSAVIELVFHQQLKGRGARWAKNYNADLLRARRMEIDLARRAYELDKGHPPENYAALVPEYLKALPKNPTTGKSLG